MHKLTLDPALRFGWCLLVDDSNLPADQRKSERERFFHGTWDLRKDDDGNRYKDRASYGRHLFRRLNALLRKHDIAEDEIEIVLEGESYGSQRSEAGRLMAAMWRASLELWCSSKERPYPVICPPDTWRSSFIKATKAPKEVGAGLEDDDRIEARRVWLKNRVLEECHKRGLKPESDNDADAIGMMHWCRNDGPDALEQKRAEKKAKSAAKRAQKQINFQVAP
jgi:hypothetical protein